VPNVFVLAFLLLFFEQFGVIGLAVTFMVGNVAQLFILIPPLRRRGFKFKPTLNLRDGGLLQILRLTPLVLISAWLFPINSTVNNFLLANHNPGVVVEFGAASTLYLVVTGFFVLSVTNVLFPRLSKEAAHDKSQFAEILSGAISGVSFFLMPMAVGLWTLRLPIIRAIYYGGEFSAASVASAADAMGILALGMLGFGLSTILSRAFFAVMDGKIPMIATLAAIIVNFALTSALVSQYGISAAAIAATASVTLAAIVMFAVMTRRFPILSRGMATGFCKMAVAAVIMGIMLYFAMEFLRGTPDIILIGTICLSGITIYFAAASVLGINEAKLATSVILARFRKDK